MELRKRLFQWFSSEFASTGCSGGDESLAKEQAAPTAEEMGFDKEPFRTGMLSISVLGASGDLAKKETFPALLDLWAHKYLPPQTFIVGYARSKKTTEEFRTWIRPHLLSSPAGEMIACKDALDSFLERCVWCSGQYDSVEDFAKLGTMLSEGEKKFYEGNEVPKETNRVFYMAIPPFAFAGAGKAIKQSAISTTGFNRIIVEKPFGHDLSSATSLAKDLGALFNEKDLYRMDHFLGYDMCQNILFVRFGNAFLDPLMNCNHVAAIRISLEENFGTLGRGGYFTQYGMIRDVIQNHLLQMLTLVAMEKPSSISSESDVRDAKLEVLKAMLPMDPKEVVLGQYTGANGQPGFLEDDSIKEADREKAKYCSTYAQLVVRLNNERWKGVPFIITAGKGLDRSRCEVRVQFKDPVLDQRLFKRAKYLRNELVMRVSPKEAVYMKMNVKSPGLWSRLQQSELDLSYGLHYDGVYCPEAYTRLILAGIRGKTDSFVRNDELLQSWTLFTPLLETLEVTEKRLPIKYAFGSQGPPEARAMLGKLDFEVGDSLAWQDDMKKMS